MKVGDLIQVTEPRSMGGRPMGAIGLVLEKYPIANGIAAWATHETCKWRIWWMSDTSVSWCKGVEVLNESR